MEIFNEKVLDDWKIVHHTNGIPCYQNEKNGKVQWKHPLYDKILEELGEFETIKYAAYRLALKIRYLQKKFYFNQIDLRILYVTLKRHGLDDLNDEKLQCSVVESFIRDLIDACYRPDFSVFGSRSNDKYPEILSHIIINWLLDLYDSNKTGELRISSVKIALLTLCSARLSEKYKYMFKQIASDNGRINRPHLQQFLSDLAKIADVFGESASFGGMNVAPAVESCFSQAWNISLGITEDEFISWLFKEPQTVVWLPTMHRLSAAETIKHDVKCSVCKMLPIVGLRYKCLQCFNYDLCQNCFLTGKISKSHKVKHPTQEYCLGTSTKENTKAFFKTLRNNFSKKHRNKQKPRYLPIASAPQRHYVESDYGMDIDEPLNMTGVSERGIDVPHNYKLRKHKTEKAKQVAMSLQAKQQTLSSVTPVESEHKKQSKYLKLDERKELASIIYHLEEENRQLMLELENAYFHPSSVNPLSQAPSTASSESEPSDWIEKDKIEARQEVIESHNEQLQRQLKRLKSLLIEQDLARSNDENKENNSTKREDKVQVMIPKYHSSSTPYNQNIPLSIPNHIDSIHSKTCSFDYNSPKTPQLLHYETPNSEMKLRNPLALRNENSLTPNNTAKGGGAMLNITPDSVATFNATNTTQDSGNLTIGRTHYSLPGLSHGAHYTAEEAQLADMLAKLETRTALDECLRDRDAVMSEMLKAVDEIGEAFTGLLINQAQPDREYESSA